MRALQPTVDTINKLGHGGMLCVFVSAYECVIMHQVNKCLCLSLNYICSLWLCSVYQLLTVGAPINIQITQEFIHLGPIYVWQYNLNIILLPACELCKHVRVCINCVTSSVYRIRKNCWSSLLSLFQTGLTGKCEKKSSITGKKFR